MRFRIGCTCGKHLDVDSANVGRKGRCPSCKAEFIVPTPPNALAASSASTKSATAASRNSAPVRKSTANSVNAGSPRSPAANVRESATNSAWNDVARSSQPHRSYQASHTSTYQHSESGGSATAMWVIIAVSIFGGGITLLAVGAFFVVPMVLEEVRNATVVEALPSDSLATANGSDPQSPQSKVPDFISADAVAKGVSSDSSFGSPYPADYGSSSNIEMPADYRGPNAVSADYGQAAHQEYGPPSPGYGSEYEDQLQAENAANRPPDVDPNANYQYSDMQPPLVGGDPYGNSGYGRATRPLPTRKRTK